MARRYQHTRKNDVLPIPLAGASGANGMLIADDHRTSLGSVQIPSASTANSHAPFSEIHRSRTSCGRGYPRPNRSNSPDSHSVSTAVTSLSLALQSAARASSLASPLICSLARQDPAVSLLTLTKRCASVTARTDLLHHRSDSLQAPQHFGVRICNRRGTSIAYLT